MVKVGRVTPSFRRLLLAEIERLYKLYRSALLDPRHQEAFDALIKIWSKESPSMMVSNISTPLEAMNLLANVGTKAELERLNAELQKLQDKAARAILFTSMNGNYFKTLSQNIYTQKNGVFSR